MNEFLGVDSLNFGIEIYFIVIFAIVLIGFVYWSYYQFEAAYKAGVSRGKFDLGSEFIKARNDAFHNGYKSALDDISRLLAVDGPKEDAKKPKQEPKEVVVKKPEVKAPVKKVAAKKPVAKKTVKRAFKGK